MVQMEKELMDAMKNLNKSPDWILVRKNWFLPNLKEINDIYDEKLNLECCENDFKAEYLSKIKAFGRLETILSKIDSFADVEIKSVLAEDFE